MSNWHKPFKHVFCETFGCSDAEFERALFRRTLFPHAIPLALIVRVIKPDVFREDFELISDIGRSENADSFRQEISYFHGRNVRCGSFCVGYRQ